MVRLSSCFIIMTWAYKSIALATPSTASHPHQPAHSSANNPPAASSETQSHRESIPHQPTASPSDPNRKQCPRGAEFHTQTHPTKSQTYCKLPQSINRSPQTPFPEHPADKSAENRRRFLYRLTPNRKLEPSQFSNR